MTNNAIYQPKGKAISNGYHVLFMPDHPSAFGRGYVYEHRYLMEQKLGRMLNKKEIVHHIDGNRMNNDISNLELCKSIAEHKYQHRSPESTRRPPRTRNVIIKCACGCGMEFLKYDNTGRERRYHGGCSIRVKERRERLKQEAYCKCGCGSKITKYDRYGRPREYLSGHNGFKIPSRVRIASGTGLSLATVANYFSGKKLRNKTVLLIENLIKEKYGKDYLRNKGCCC